MPEPVTRRVFLELAVAGSALLLAPAHARAADPPMAWIIAGPAAKIVAGTFFIVEANGERAFVTRSADGTTVVALYGRCTHFGCKVQYRDAEKQFVCPCHGGRFDGHGTAVAGPPRRPLTALETRIDAQGILSVHLPTTAPDE